MSWQDLPIEVFLDLVADMPDTEAVDELDVRIEQLEVRRASIPNHPSHNDARKLLNKDEDRLRLRRAKIIKRIEARKWSKAVRAVFGPEGLEQCIEWMRNTPEDDVKERAQRRRRIVDGEARW